ncbi:MAG: Meiotic nuclear division protein 1 [Paramarteilia canceri]
MGVCIADDLVEKDQNRALCLPLKITNDSNWTIDDNISLDEEFYQLKDLEKICPASKGITSMSVKEVLMSLVYDDLVETEKIGLSTYYWSLPSKIGEKWRKKCNNLSEHLLKFENELKNKEEVVKEAEILKADSKERTKLNEKLESLQEKLSSIDKELKTYQENDPEQLKILEKEINTIKNDANKTTDNLFNTFSFLNRNFPHIDQKTLISQYELPEDMDYI